MTNYILYCDGGGNPTTRTYFSYRLFENNKPVESMQMNRFLCRNLPPDEIPLNCSIVDDRGLSTNNIAEFAAAFFSVKRFKDEIGTFPLTVYQDSQLIVNQINDLWKCKKSHLQKWLNAINSIRWNTLKFEWIPREIIVPILGH